MSQSDNAKNEKINIVTALKQLGRLYLGAFLSWASYAYFIFSLFAIQ